MAQYTFAINAFDYVARGVPPAERFATSQDMERHYFNTLEGLLTPPHLLDLLCCAVEKGGAEVLRVLSGAHTDVFATPVYEAALQAHARERVFLAELRADGALDEEPISICELFLDIVLVQRALMDDVRTSAAECTRGEATAVAVSRAWHSGRLLFPHVLAHVRKPELIVTRMDAADAQRLCDLNLPAAGPTRLFSP